ncbi:HET-domain-containing protein, partial [Cryphonectria parasitica EP155]
MTQALPTITPVYAGLNGSRSQIRFIHLLPGSFNEAIRCNLETITLSMDTTLPFEALSYVWGNDEPRKFILLNGQPWPVGRNLAHILRRLRYEDRARSLWVDEVCINQDDVDEKFHQVRLLAKVYKQSARCLIWLGNVDEGSE